MASPLNANPYLLMDPEASLRAFCDGTAAVVPAPLIETDEEAASRIVASQLGQDLPLEASTIDQLWARIDRS